MAAKDLIPYHFTGEQSRTQAVENGRKGGAARQQKKREGEEARQVAKTILGLMPDLPQEVVNTMWRMGMSKRRKKPNIREISTLAIAQKAMKGDKLSYEFLVELAGEAEKAPTVNINTFIGTEEGPGNADVVSKTMDRMSDEQLRVFEEICALYSEIESEEAERASADKTSAEPAEVEADGSVE